MRLGMRLLAATLAVVASVAVPALPVSAQGLFRYAAVSEPPPLDSMVTTAEVATIIGLHIYETLYISGADFVPQPMLASGERIEDDGKTIIIGIREGVKFHNGKALTADDVVASLKRWGEFGVRGKLLMANAVSVEATGTHEVTLKLSEPNGAWKALLANIDGGPAIYPAEIVSKAGAEPIPQDGYIGTGPYMFKEWRPNRYVEVVRYEGYSPRSEPADGYAGARVANFDAIRFIPVPDVGTRVSGVQAGDYDYAETISGDLYDQLAADASVKVQRRGAPLFGVFFMNSKAGLFKENFPLRRAVQMALKKDEALSVSFGPQALWNAQGSMYPPGNPWYSEAGIEAYNQNDVAGAKALATEAGYTGEPIKLLVSTNYQTHYDQAVVFTKQLAQAGINVQLVVVDWATLLKLRADPEQWDIFVTHQGFVPDPILLGFMSEGYPGWWSSPEIQVLRKELAQTFDPVARKAVWDKIQTLAYEQVPAMKVGDAYSFDIASPKVKGLGEHTVSIPHFWNASY